MSCTPATRNFCILGRLSLSMTLRKHCAQIVDQLLAELPPCDLVPAYLAERRAQQMHALNRQYGALHRYVGCELRRSARFCLQLLPLRTQAVEKSEGGLVLHMLLIANGLARQLACMSLASLEANAHPWYSINTSKALQILLRIRSLRCCALSELGGRRIHGARATPAQLDALIQMIDERMRALLPQVRHAIADLLLLKWRMQGWPGELKLAAFSSVTNGDTTANSPAIRIGGAFAQALVLQHSSYEATGQCCEMASAGGDGTALWALNELSSPVLARFRFHFEGRRETNRRDKPEWVFSQCTAILRLHHQVLSQQVQLLLVQPVPMLKRLMHGTCLGQLETHLYLSMLRCHCAHGCYLDLAVRLCDAVRAKLLREMNGRLMRQHSFSHMLNELVGFEGELQDALQLSPHAGGVIRAVCDFPTSLQRWLSMEVHEGLAVLATSIATVSGAKISPRSNTYPPCWSKTRAAAPNMTPPSCVVPVVRFLLQFNKRLKLVSVAEVQMQLVCHALLPILIGLHTQLNTRFAATKAMLLLRHEPGDWDELGALLQVLHYCAPLLLKWQASEPYGTLLLILAHPNEKPCKTKLTCTSMCACRAHCFGDGIFGGVLQLWRELRDQTEQILRDALTVSLMDTSQYLNGCVCSSRSCEQRTYISATICTIISFLRAELNGMRTVVPPPSMHRVLHGAMPRLHQAVGEICIRCPAQFPLISAQQLVRDMDALITLFAPFASQAKSGLMVRDVMRMAA